MNSSFFHGRKPVGSPEIARGQLGPWVHHGPRLDDERSVTLRLVREACSRERAGFCSEANRILRTDSLDRAPRTLDDE